MRRWMEKSHETGFVFQLDFSATTDFIDGILTMQQEEPKISKSAFVYGFVSLLSKKCITYIFCHSPSCTDE